jgi:hypothetical protein
MRSHAILIFPLSLLASMAISQAVRAEKVCKVTDPTGTPLNVRSSPNGRIVNALLNGREVYIQETASDEQGRTWALVTGNYRGEYRTWGWVFREFITCYNKPNRNLNKD